MTTTGNKLRAVLFTALTVSAATFSTMNTVSANERTHGGHNRHTNGHTHRHNGSGSFNAREIGLAIGMASAIIAVRASRVHAEARNPKTGERVRSQGPRGRHVVTRTNGRGQVVDIKAANNDRASASATDKKTGVTTTSIGNPDKSRTVTKTNADGKEVEREVKKPGPASASSTDKETGVTTTSVANGNGSRTVIKTSANGKILSAEVVR